MVKFSKMLSVTCIGLASLSAVAPAFATPSFWTPRPAPPRVDPPRPRSVPELSGTAGATGAVVLLGAAAIAATRGRRKASA